VQSLTEVYQAARLRHAAGAAGMLPTEADADPDSVLDSPFAWQVHCQTIMWVSGILSSALGDDSLGQPCW